MVLHALTVPKRWPLSGRQVYYTLGRRKIKRNYACRMMLWAKETELINLEPMSGAQSLLGYVIGILAHRTLFLLPQRSRVDFIHFQAVQFTSMET